MSPGIPTDETRLARFGRRAVTVPGYVLLFAAAVVASPVLVPLAVAIDAGRRRPLPTVRLILFLTHYLACETLGLAASFAVWLGSGAGASRARFVAWNHALQRWWAGALLAGARRIYALELEVKGEEAVGRGPLVVFGRHASVGDVLLPAVLLSTRHGLRLRYVIKRELLWDPCLDVVGQRVPNAFVRRDSGDSAREIEAIRRLAAGMAPDEGILIYPEGTRFSAAKRERVLARLARAGDDALLDRARGLRHVLPPRLGGPLALLDACPEADVLFLCHSGFEGSASFRELWRGTLIGRCIRVALWRVPAADVPPERQARIEWLYAHWERMDAWLEAQVSRSAPPRAGS